jgi:small subunit ribosomal protein S15e
MVKLGDTQSIGGYVCYTLDCLCSLFSRTFSPNAFYRRNSQGSLTFITSKMDAEKVAELRKKRQFRKFTFRGVELDALLDLTNDELMDLVHARARRRMSRGLKRKPMALIKRLRQAKKDAPAGEKPRGVKTHLRNMIIVPEMIGSIVGIYNGKMFCGVEMKPEMVGMYLGEFAITYKPVRHGRPGVSAAHQTRFIPL